MSGATRLASGGRIDRSRLLHFDFDGKSYAGHPGDTLASALLANGVRLVGRSFKYHRPRGVYGLGGEEPNALVHLGEGARLEPNLRATQVELFSGLTAESQNRWPCLGFDVGAVNDLASRLLPAGFYYKTFKWPASWWMRYERVIRRMAGLGRAPLRSDPDVYAKRFAHCDVLVVGAGPSGLAAASAAAARGARVILVEERPDLGGYLADNPMTLDDAPAEHWVERVTAQLEAAPNVTVLSRATAFGYYDQNLVSVCERVTDHLASPDPLIPRQRVWWIRARQVVLATGSIERPLVFADNDRPGVMSAAAVRAYIHRHAVLCGQRAVVFTNNDTAYETGRRLVEAGASVSVVDVRGTGPGDGARQWCESAGVRRHDGAAVVRAVGRCGVRGADIARIDLETGRVARGGERLECDLICVSGGHSPTVHLYSQSQGKPRFDEAMSAFVPGDPRPGQAVIGAATGEMDLGRALRAGQAAGAEAAQASGHRAGALPDLPDAPAMASEAPLAPVWAVAPPGDGGGKRFVDFQNDVTADDVALAHREGYESVEHLKRYTTLGMGTDQGRTSNVNGLALMAGMRGETIPDVGTTTFRPPFAPVTVGAIAGTEVGEAFSPVRRTAMHDWHERAGAPFVTAGQWLRPQYYPRPGEGVMDSINREALAVRRSVGLVDVSTLGKIAVRGRDAGEFLERVYINRWKNLKVGKVRYGFMLREDGFILDDGTTTRVSEDEYYMTTSTAHAGPVLAHLEFYAQTVWPELHVHLASITDQWAGMALAGPNARRVLGAACDGMDVSNEALPFMGYLESTVAGAPVRIFRMTFSGELAYEIHTPCDFGVAVWERVLEAGRDFGIMPYGTEALGILRIEKGHVVTSELDGTTITSDFGFDRLERRDSDFIGKRSMDRPALRDEPRKTFVGLVSQDGQHIPRGSQLVTNPTKPRPVAMLGHVTSTCYSPNLDKEIALALLVDADAWRGEVLYAASPLGSTYVPVRVTNPVFIDPQGARARV